MQILKRLAINTARNRQKSSKREAKDLQGTDGLWTSKTVLSFQELQEDIDGFLLSVDDLPTIHDRADVEHCRKVWPGLGGQSFVAGEPALDSLELLLQSVDFPAQHIFLLLLLLLLF